MTSTLTYTQALAERDRAELRLLSDPLVYNAVQHAKRAAAMKNPAERDVLLAQVLIAFSAAEREFVPMRLGKFGSFRLPKRL